MICDYSLNAYKGDVRQPVKDFSSPASFRLDFRTIIYPICCHIVVV